LQFLPPQNIEHILASAIDRRNASDNAPYLAVATVADDNKQYVNINHTIVIINKHFTTLAIMK